MIVDIIILVSCLAVIFGLRQVDKSNSSLEKVKKFTDKVKGDFDGYFKKHAIQSNNAGIELDVKQSQAIAAVKRLEQNIESFEIYNKDIAQKLTTIDTMKKQISDYESAIKDLFEMTERVEENLEIIRKHSVFVDKVSHQVDDQQNRLAEIETTIPDIVAEFGKQNDKGLDLLRSEFSSWLERRSIDLQALAEAAVDKNEILLDEIHQTCDQSFALVSDKVGSFEDEIFEKLKEQAQERFEQFEDILSRNTQDLSDYIEREKTEMDKSLSNKITKAKSSIATFQEEFQKEADFVLSRAKDKMNSSIADQEETVLTSLTQQQAVVNTVIEKTKELISSVSDGQNERLQAMLTQHQEQLESTIEKQRDQFNSEIQELRQETTSELAHQKRELSVFNENFADAEEIVKNMDEITHTKQEESKELLKRLQQYLDFDSDSYLQKFEEKRNAMEDEFRNIISALHKNISNDNEQLSVDMNNRYDKIKANFDSRLLDMEKKLISRQEEVIKNNIGHTTALFADIDTQLTDAKKDMDYRFDRLYGVGKDIDTLEDNFRQLMKESEERVAQQQVEVNAVMGKTDKLISSVNETQDERLALVMLQHDERLQSMLREHQEQLESAIEKQREQFNSEIKLFEQQAAAEIARQKEELSVFDDNFSRAKEMIKDMDGMTYAKQQESKDLLERLQHYLDFDSDSYLKEFEEKTSSVEDEFKSIISLLYKTISDDTAKISEDINTQYDKIRVNFDSRLLNMQNKLIFGQDEVVKNNMDRATALFGNMETKLAVAKKDMDHKFSSIGSDINSLESNFKTLIKDTEDRIHGEVSVFEKEFQQQADSALTKAKDKIDSSITEQEEKILADLMQQKAMVNTVIGKTDQLISSLKDGQDKRLASVMAEQDERIQSMFRKHQNQLESAIEEQRDQFKKQTADEILRQQEELSVFDGNFAQAKGLLKDLDGITYAKQEESKELLDRLQHYLDFDSNSYLKEFEQKTNDMEDELKSIISSLYKDVSHDTEKLSEDMNNQYNKVKVNFDTRLLDMENMLISEQNGVVKKQEEKILENFAQQDEHVQSMLMQQQDKLDAAIEGQSEHFGQHVADKIAQHKEELSVFEDNFTRTKEMLNNMDRMTQEKYQDGQMLLDRLQHYLDFDSDSYLKEFEQKTGAVEDELKNIIVTMHKSITDDTEKLSENINIQYDKIKVDFNTRLVDMEKMLLAGQDEVVKNNVDNATVLFAEIDAKLSDAKKDMDYRFERLDGIGKDIDNLSGNFRHLMKEAEERVREEVDSVLAEAKNKVASSIATQEEKVLADLVDQQNEVHTIIEKTDQLILSLNEGQDDRIAEIIVQQDERLQSMLNQHQENLESVIEKQHEQFNSEIKQFEQENSAEIARQKEELSLFDDNFIHVKEMLNNMNEITQAKQEESKELLDRLQHYLDFDSDGYLKEFWNKTTGMEDEFNTIISTLQKNVHDDAEKILIDMNSQYDQIKENIDTRLIEMENVLTSGQDEVVKNNADRASSFFADIDTQLTNAKKDMDYRFDRLDTIGKDIEALESDFRHLMKSVEERVVGEFETFKEERSNAQTEFEAEIAGSFDNVKASIANLDTELLNLKKRAYDSVSDKLQLFEDDFFGDLNSRSETLSSSLMEWKDGFDTRLLAIANHIEENGIAMESKYLDEISGQLQITNEKYREHVVHLEDEVKKSEIHLKDRMNNMETTLDSFIDLQRSEMDATKDKAIEYLKIELENQLQSATEQFNRYEAMIEDAQQNIRDENTDAEEKLHALKSMVQEVREQNEDAQEKMILKIQTEANRLSMNMDDVDKRLKQFVEQIQLFDKVDDMKNDLEKKMGDLQVHMARFDNFTQVTDTIEQQFAKIRKIDDDVSEALQNFSSEQQRIDSLATDFSNLLNISLTADKKISDFKNTSDDLQVLQVDARRFHETLADISNRYDRLEKKNNVLDQTMLDVDKTFEGVRELEERLAACTRQTMEMPILVDNLKSDLSGLMEKSQSIGDVMGKLNTLDTILIQTNQQVEDVQKAQEWIARTEARLGEMTKDAKEQVNLFTALIKGGSNKNVSGAPPIAVRENVIKLAHQGWKTEQISASLNLTIGEVELILDFYGKEER